MSFEKEIELKDWIVDFFSKNNKYLKNQRENYLYMKNNLDNYINSKGKM